MLELAKEVSKKIIEANGRPYFVGGYVRDKLLGIRSKDIDIEVFGLEVDKLESILAEFGQVNLVGKQYGIYKLGDLDIGLPRTERKTGVGHKDFVASVNPTMSLPEAALRRDFTMNAIYYDLQRDAYVDPYNGIDDLCAKKVIKHVSPVTFGEDPLRAVRAARFRAIFPHLSLYEETRLICSKIPKSDIRSLPKDRIFTEFEKALMKAKMPSIFFHVLQSVGILHTIFPELYETQFIEQGEKYHPEGSVFNHTMLAIDVLGLGERELDVMLALLFHDLGKASVKQEIKEDGHISFHGHQTEVLDLAAAMNRITNNVDLFNSVYSLVTHHMRPYDFKKATAKKKHIRRFATEVDIPKLMKVHKGDKYGRGIPLNPEESKCFTPDEFLALYEEIKNETKPLIKGRDLIELGLVPSKEFSLILNAIFSAQLDGEFLTYEDGITFTKDMISGRLTESS